MKTAEDAKDTENSKIRKEKSGGRGRGRPRYTIS